MDTNAFPDASEGMTMTNDKAETTERHWLEGNQLCSLWHVMPLVHGFGDRSKGYYLVERDDNNEQFYRGPDIAAARQELEKNLIDAESISPIP